MKRNASSNFDEVERRIQDDDPELGQLWFEWYVYRARFHENLPASSHTGLPGKARRYDKTVVRRSAKLLFDQAVQQLHGPKPKPKRKRAPARKQTAQKRTAAQQTPSTQTPAPEPIRARAQEREEVEF